MTSFYAVLRPVRPVRSRASLTSRIPLTPRHGYLRSHIQTRRRHLWRPRRHRAPTPAALPPLPSPSSFLAPQPGLLPGLLANTVVYIAGNRVLLKGLSVDGYLSSYILGWFSYAAFGVSGYALVCLYFLIGSWVTKLKMDVKMKEGTAEARGGRRGVGSVLGSGVAGLACAAAVLLGPSPALGGLGVDALRVGFAASFCSKLSDTVSSEVGKAYGKTTYLATSFKKVPRGTEGAVSLEGTAAGIAGSVALGLCAAASGLISWSVGLPCVITAAFVANYAESLVGATFQDRVRWLTNDVVNMLQISLSSAVAMLLYVSSIR